MTALALQEWKTYTPADTPELVGRDLTDAAARRLAGELTGSERLKVLELRNGLQVETSSYVGTVRLGGLHITIQPKLHGLPLLNLLRYAYGLRNLSLFEPLRQGVPGPAFHDLLIHQLSAEVSELLARGLQRRYQREDALLASPRGRIDFDALAQLWGAATASLPCSHHPRQEDTPHNQALLAGLRHGTRLTEDLELRSRLRRLSALLADRVSMVGLSADLLRQVQRRDDRLSAAYGPSLQIIKLLLAGQGITLRPERETAAVPGFLFDMNRFFQALISRFLHEHLSGYALRDEYGLHGMLGYEPGRNPQRRKAPAPRPDFVVLQGGRVAAMLDAKYRDLWEQPLPRGMLYQLVIYASSREAGGRAAILYPTLNAAAEEQWIEVLDPLAGGRRAEVVLRPVNMLRLEQLVTGEPSAQRERDASAFARWLAFGETRFDSDLPDSQLVIRNNPEKQF